MAHVIVRPRCKAGECTREPVLQGLCRDCYNAYKRNYRRQGYDRGYYVSGPDYTDARRAEREVRN